MFGKLKFKSFGIFLLILVLGASIYGFAAANTVPATQAGDGSGAITGYTISNISYTLNSSNPSLIDAVHFDTTGTPGTVEIQLDGSTWYSCSFSTTWDCDTTSPAADVLSATSLRVIAVE